MKVFSEMIEKISENEKETGYRSHNVMMTSIYNEGWLLKLFLNWYCRNLDEFGADFFPKSGKWFSEASIGTFFGSKNFKKCDRQTKADAIIGDFEFHSDKKTEAILSEENFKRIAIIEAKLKSPFSPRTKNGKDYDQMTRYIGNAVYMMMANEIRTGNQCDGGEIDIIAIIPKSHKIIKNKMVINVDGSFFMGVEIDGILENYKEQSIKKIIKRLKEKNSGEKTKRKNFEANLAKFDVVFKGIRVVTWEEIIEGIPDKDSFKTEFQSFYNKCCKYNDVETKSD